MDKKLAAGLPGLTLVNGQLKIARQAPIQGKEHEFGTVYRDLTEEEQKQVDLFRETPVHKKLTKLFFQICF